MTASHALAHRRGWPRAADQARSGISAMAPHQAVLAMLATTSTGCDRGLSRL
jgi:hypothetical protein